VLFWLVLMIALAIIFIGARFIVWPREGADGFGIPPDQQTSAYLWAKGTRDIVLGLFVILLLSHGVDRRALSEFIGVATLIPIGDFINVYLNAAQVNFMALGIHGGTALLMLVLAGFLWAGSRERV
jgi:hypothetical protein